MEQVQEAKHSTFGQLPSRRPYNTFDIPAYGSPLDNWNSHFIGMSPNAPAFSAKYGYVPPYLRTTNRRYAKETDGRNYKHSFTAEVPFRQNVKAGYYPQFVTSPGKSVNKSKLTGQDALVMQALRARGY